MEETTTSAAVLNYLASREKQGKLATPQQNEQAAAYRSMARASEKTEELTQQQKQSLIDVMRKRYDQLGAGSPINYTRLNFERMYLHYKFGNGRTMYIDITGLNFPMISASKDFNNEAGRIEHINTFDRSPFSTVGLTLGSVRFKYLGGRKVSIEGKDRYDFDYQHEASFKRNMGTIIGGLIHNLPVGFDPENGWNLPGGSSYDIYFKGEASISE